MASRDASESEPEVEPEDEQLSDGEEDAESGKKKKKENMPRDWMEVERWRRSDHSDGDIEVFVRKHLDDLNRAAGILYAIPGAHKKLTNIYGDFQFRRKWQTNQCRVTNYSKSCPLRDLCGCQCEIKISHDSEPDVTIMYIHSAEDHVCEKDRAKFLKFQQLL